MNGNWITLYDVRRDGIGIIPWVLTVSWIASTFIAIRLRMTDRPRKNNNWFAIWMVVWVIGGLLGIGNILHQYFANCHALNTGSCKITEGNLADFHREALWKKGDTEHFVVAGHEFEYSSANLGGAGLRSSDGLHLRDGLHVRIWDREGVIVRLDTAK